MSRMSRHRVIDRVVVGTCPLALIVVALLVSACSLTTSTSGTSSSGISTPAANSSPISSTYASCNLATIAEMTATTGVTVTQATQVANICLYDVGDANHEITAAVSPYSDTARAQQVITDICKLGQPIAGLGDKACIIANPGGAVAEVLRGHYPLAVAVGSILGITDMAGVATKIARLMTPRLMTPRLQ